VYQLTAKVKLLQIFEKPNRMSQSTKPPLKREGKFVYLRETTANKNALSAEL
jgi:hypothetical protein